MVLLDQYFQNVCENDLVFGFLEAYTILDEFLLAGEVQESSVTRVGRELQKQEAAVTQELLGEFMF